MGPWARSRFGAPIFEPEVFRKQMYSIEESTCDTVATFRHPPQSSSDPAVVQWLGTRESVTSLSPPRYATVR